MPGGGFLVRFLNGVLDALHRRREGHRWANGNVPSGAVSVTMISPVLSSVSMPEMSFAAFGSFWNSSAPSMPVKNELTGPSG